jgi:hypothetical protein
MAYRLNRTGLEVAQLLEKIDDLREATTMKSGTMTALDKRKLDGITAGAEVNQNAFSNIKVGSTTIAADGKTDTLELVAGTSVTLTPDATNGKVTIGISTGAVPVYSTMTQATLDTGTSTAGNLVGAKLLKDNFYTKDETDAIVGNIETLLATL